MSSNSSIFDDLHSYDSDNEPEEESDLDDNPNQSNASSPLPDKENTHVSEGCASINSLSQVELNDISAHRLTQEAFSTASNPLSFPH